MLVCFWLSWVFFVFFYLLRVWLFGGIAQPRCNACAGSSVSCPQRRLTSECCCLQVPSCVDVEFLFGNMEEIADVSQRLLTSLESAISGKAFQDQIVGRLCTPL